MPPQRFHNRLLNLLSRAHPLTMGNRIKFPAASNSPAPTFWSVRLLANSEDLGLSEHCALLWTLRAPIVGKLVGEELHRYVAAQSEVSGS